MLGGGGGGGGGVWNMFLNNHPFNCSFIVSCYNYLCTHITIICRLTHAPNSVIHLSFVSLYSTELSYRGDTKFYSDSCQPLSSQFTVIFQTAAFLY